MRLRPDPTLCKRWETPLLGHHMLQKYSAASQQRDLMSGSFSAWCKNSSHVLVCPYSKDISHVILWLTPASSPIIYLLAPCCIPSIPSLSMLMSTWRVPTHSILSLERLSSCSSSGWHLWSNDTCSKKTLMSKVNLPVDHSIWFPQSPQHRLQYYTGQLTLSKPIDSYRTILSNMADIDIHGYLNQKM